MTAQAVGVLLYGQVQQYVGRTEVLMAARAVGDPRHADFPEHALKRSPMPSLDAAPAHPVHAANLLAARLALAAQIQVILQQQAIQLARVELQARLKLTVRQATSSVPSSHASVLSKRSRDPAKFRAGRRRLARRAAQITPRAPGRFHRPTRNLHHNGCRTRRSRCHPPKVVDVGT